MVELDSGKLKSGLFRILLTYSLIVSLEESGTAS